MECVSTVSAVFTVMFLLPFAIEPFLTPMKPSHWHKSAENIQWSPFISSESIFVLLFYTHTHPHSCTLIAMVIPVHSIY